MSIEKILCVLGNQDIPVIQEQPDFSVDLLDSNILLFGAPMSGKTNLIRSVFRHLQFLFYFLMCNWFRRRCKFRCLLFRKLRAAVLRNIVTSQFINRLIKAVSSNKYEAIKRIVCSSNSVIVAIPRICFWFNAKSREFFHVKLISFSLN